MASHAAYPTPVRIDRERIRVFFIARDEGGRGTVGWIDLSAGDPMKILRVCQSPALTPGETGSFDDRGVALGNIVPFEGKLRLYYMGWNAGNGVPFRNAIGIAESTDAEGDRFERLFTGPIIDRSRHDPFSLSYPFAITEVGGWSMIYGSHRGPGVSERDMDHSLMSATSKDGIDWQVGGGPLIALAAGELGHSRPWILEWRSQRHLLFSVRRDQYEISTARQQLDGTWTRGPVLSFDDARSGGWDNEARCYASHIQIDGVDYLFYNGNGYGRTGFGLAVLES